MRAFKFVAIAIGGLVALLAVVLLAVWLFVDPNDYKERIARAVQSATGRELAMPGTIKLSLFPWLALQIGPASLGNPAGFGAEPIAVVQRATARVKLLALLRGDLQVGRVEIEGLDLRLKKNAAGKGNWEDFGVKSKPQEQRPTSSSSLDLAGVSIRSSRISFDTLVADKVDLDIGHVAPGALIPVQVALELRTDPASQPIRVAGSFDLALEPADRYRLAALDLGGTIVPKVGVAAVPWKFATAALNIDLAAQTLGTTSFSAQLAAAQLTGHLSGTRIIDAPDLRGDFVLEPLALRELMTQLGIAAPVTRDTHVLSKLAARGEFAYAGDAARADKLKLQLDDSALEGRFALDLATTAMDFDLALDRLDIDRYLPPPSTTPVSGKKAPFELPTATLKPLRANGNFAIGQVKIAGVALANVSVHLDALDGMTQLAPLKAQLYGGLYSGDITVDSRASQPLLKMEQTMTGIDVARLLSDFAQTKRLSGKGNVSTSLTAQGHNGDALIRSLRGKVSANLANGAIEGLDLWYAVNQAQSLLRKQALAEGANSGRTAFDTFKVSAVVAGGVATTEDLNIVSQQLRVSGKGSANLATQAIDYQVTATVLKSAAGATLTAIPVKITGTFDDPKVRADVAGMAKARVEQELDKHKDEIKEKIGEKLKGLFGR
jgi:AsmA protein